MARPKTSKKTVRKPQRKRRRGLKLSRFWPSAPLRRRWWRTLRRAPTGAQAMALIVIVLLLWLAVNWVYQVMRKPTELFFPVSGTLYKNPAATWDKYASLFREHATPVMTAELLAALAQVEGSGNPIARTYWRWSLTSRPFNVYRPASSAVGMYQITDGTFAEAQHYCIHHHAVAEDGAWDNIHSCWFNAFYTRVFPSNAIELTSAYLDHHIADTLLRLRIADATLAQKQNLAAMIHLCGAGAGERYAQRRFHFALHQRCGDHDAAAYIARVNAMKMIFARLASQDYD